MNRRFFLTRGLSMTAAVALAVSIPMSLLNGCAVNPEELLNAVVTSAQGLLKVVGNEPWAPQLSTALSSLVAAEASWKSGGPITVVEDALGTIMQIVAVVPITAPYSPLVDILVAAIDGILAVLPQGGGQVSARVNAHIGRARLKKPHVFQTQVGAYKKQWNDEATSLGLSAAKF